MILQNHYLFLGIDGRQSLVPWMNTALLLMVLALVLLLTPMTRRNERSLTAACILVISDIWIDKGLGLVSGGFIPSPLHAINEYRPTLTELLISLRIYALGGLILTVLL